MKISDTISVNPGKTTLGHVETNSAFFRSSVLHQEKTDSLNDILKFVLPSEKSALKEYTKYAVPLRTLFATLLIVCGISYLSSLTGSYMQATGICSLIFGGLLALGLLTRPVMIGAAAYYCIIGALLLRGGSIDMSLFSLMFGCLIFGVMGAGKYSCDTLLRHSYRTFRKNQERKRKEQLSSYKVFHNVKF